MNDLRFILLGIGVIVIAGIYFWEIFKQKRHIRSRIEKYPSFNHDGIANLKIKHKIEQDEDFSGALADFNFFLNQSRKDGQNESGELKSQQANQISTHEEFNKEQIVVLYITANSQQSFSGPDILRATVATDMHFGAMNIFHYYEAGDTKKALFSLANMLEPGHFNIQQMETFSTTGLALFMCLPAKLEGAVAFDLLLGTAQALAELLSGEVRDIKRKLLNPTSINKMRETASRY